MYLQANIFSQWRQDVPYLSPILEEIKAEENEKKALDSLTVVRNH